MSTDAGINRKVDFGYNQFMVFDEVVRLPGCDWTAAHFNQGFARCESLVSFRTLLEYGTAALTIVRDAYADRHRYDRVISVPFCVTSGKVFIEGPEEAWINRFIKTPPGHYRLTAAQWLVEEEEQSIDLFFEPLAEPLIASEILIADAELNPPTPLIETVGIAGED